MPRVLTGKFGTKFLVLAEQFFAEIEKALEEGHLPLKHPEVNGREKTSAVRVAGIRMGMKSGAIHSRFAASVKALGREPDWSKWSGYREKNPAFTVDALPSFQLSTDEIRERRRQEWDRRHTAKEARRLIAVSINTNDAIGILHQGDPHLDDPGTNFPLIERHIDLINSTPGLFGSCVGDFINNWRGKLAHLHGAQTTTQIEALKLLEWYIKAVRWLYLIGGNHDVWHGEGDPLLWFRSGLGNVYEWHGARICLRFPNGRECRIHARHAFPGNSMYNPAHGATKAAMFAGEDHVYVSGHIHNWAYMSQENPIKDLVWHAVQLASYKKIDDYADVLGKDAKRYGEAALTVINPRSSSPANFVHVFWDVEEGADFLTFLRKKAAA